MASLEQQQPKALVYTPRCFRGRVLIVNIPTASPFGGLSRRCRPEGWGGRLPDGESCALSAVSDIELMRVYMST